MYSIPCPPNSSDDLCLFFCISILLPMTDCAGGPVFGHHHGLPLGLLLLQRHPRVSHHHRDMPRHPLPPHHRSGTISAIFEAQFSRVRIPTSPLAEQDLLLITKIQQHKSYHLLRSLSVFYDFFASHIQY